MVNELKSSIALLQSYLTWLMNISPGQRVTYILTLSFVLFVVAEWSAPRDSQPQKQLRQSYRANIGLFAFNSAFMSLLSVTTLLVVAEQYAGKGLLNYIQNPIWKSALSFLAVDLLLYLLHKACHHFDSLWMFHKVHHNDPCLNSSTAFRIHLLEVLVINCMKALLIIVLGIKGSALLMNEAAVIFFTMFHHANISFRGEKALGRVFITPYLHRVHHSAERSEHDRNYGAVLSIWDRLFGTLAELKPAAIGLKESSSQDVIGLIKAGFSNRSSLHAVNLAQ
jgi:sterol desaturase/sphingolipid hydroxylase (fatty acid hydroxylase superfamily)